MGWILDSIPSRIDDSYFASETLLRNAHMYILDRVDWHKSMWAREEDVVSNIILWYVIYCSYKHKIFTPYPTCESYKSWCKPSIIMLKPLNQG